MAAGQQLGGLLTALMPLVALIAVVRGRKRGEPRAVDEALEKRRDATRESERRMQAYLAQRGFDGQGDQDEVGQ